MGAELGLGCQGSGCGICPCNRTIVAQNGVCQCKFEVRFNLSLSHRFDNPDWVEEGQCGLLYSYRENSISKTTDLILECAQNGLTGAASVEEQCRSSFRRRSELCSGSFVCCADEEEFLSCNIRIRETGECGEAYSCFSADGEETQTFPPGGSDAYIQVNLNSSGQMEVLEADIMGCGFVSGTGGGTLPVVVQFPIGSQTILLNNPYPTYNGNVTSISGTVKIS